MEKKLMGVFAPISTPFTADGRVDYEGLAQNVKHYAAAGLKGYLALGSNGENKSLSNAEKLRVLETIVQNKGAGQTVMAVKKLLTEPDITVKSGLSLTAKRMLSMLPVELSFTPTMLGWSAQRRISLGLRPTPPAYWGAL